MAHRQKTDLRVVKTHAAIQNAFKAMVMEGREASQITVKALAERALIHRKTFYLHYTSVEALFEELLRELEDAYYREIDQLPPDAPFSEVNRVFFTFMAAQEPYMETLVCSTSYREFSDRLFAAMLVHNRARYDPYAAYTPAQKNIINTFLSITSVNLYRCWVQDQKSLTLPELIELSGTLFTQGITAIPRDGSRK